MVLHGRHVGVPRVGAAIPMGVVVLAEVCSGVVGIRGIPSQFSQCLCPDLATILHSVLLTSYGTFPGVLHEAGGALVPVLSLEQSPGFPRVRILPVLRVHCCIC